MEAAENDEDETLLTGYRPIRRVTSPDVPWPGVLTRMPNGEACVRVAAAHLGAEWLGWGAQQAGHLLGPIEVIRRADGHDAALPVCSERVADFLARRQSLAVPLAGGELVTLGVSLLRGEAELARAGHEAVGEWWLTDAGRPVFATGVAAHSADSAPSAAELIDTFCCTAEPVVAQVMTDAVDSLASARTILRDVDELERRLFDIADPVPLQTALLAPLRARALVPASDQTVGPVDPHTPRPRLLSALAGHVDSDLAELVSVATTDLWRRLRSRSGRRRRPWVVASGVAAAIVGVGLLWPGGAGGPATADGANLPHPTPSAGAEPTPPGPESEPTVPEPTPVEVDSGEFSVGGGETRGQQWVTETDALLAVRNGCAGEADCLSEVVEEPTRSFSAGVVDLPARERSTTLLDDFGGAAVLRVDAIAAGVAPQLVFVVRVDQRTLLRDIHDVAEQSG